MPFVHDEKNRLADGANKTGQAGWRQTLQQQVRGMGAAEGQSALSPRGQKPEKGNLQVMRGVEHAAKVLQPDPQKPETCRLPVRIVGHEQLKGVIADYDRMLTLVFCKIMDLFRGFGMEFDLILGGTAKAGDVLIDASQSAGRNPLLGAGFPAQGPAPAPNGNFWGDGPGPVESMPPTMEPPNNGTTPTGPTREPGRPVGNVPPTVEPPVREPPGPEWPGRPPTNEPPTVEPPVREPPTREPPEPPEIVPPREWPVVAKDETAKVWGDPHFVGADGGKFDVQGEAGKTYNLLSDSGLKLYGTFDGWGNGITVVGSTGLTVNGAGGESKVLFNAKKDKVSVDGKELQKGKSVVLADGGTVTRKGKDVIATTAEGYRIVQHDQGKHIDAEVTSGKRGVHNGQMPTGLMGVTFDADKARRDGKKGKGAQGEGAIDGVVDDYEVAGGVFGDLKSSMNKGDIDGDGNITLADAQLAMEAAIGQRTLKPVEAMRADVDGDGHVSMADAVLILRAAQSAGNVGMRRGNGNGKPLRIPKDGHLTVSILDTNAMHPVRMEAHDPRLHWFFSGAPLANVQGSTDLFGEVGKGDEFNPVMQADAMGGSGYYDMSRDGEDFQVEELGEGHWRIKWNGVQAASKGDFSAVEFEVQLHDKAKQNGV